MIRHLAPLPRAPGPRVAEVYTQLKRDFGLLTEPITLHTPVPDLLAAAWATLRETVIADGRLPRRIKEAMALAISTANRCPYCVDAHAVMLHGLGEATAERALEGGGAPADPRLAAFVTWARASGNAAAAGAVRPPFAPEAAPEAIGTALCFHYINRMVTVLLDQSPLPTLAVGRARPWLRRPLLDLVGRRFAGALRSPHPPGESLSLFAPAAAGEDLAWAAASPPIAAAFAAFAAAAEGAAAAVLEPATRRRLRQLLGGWQGEAPPLGSDWLAPPLADLETSQQPAARLALLAAWAPERLGEAEIGAFRRRWPADAALVGVLAWGSHEAARRISSWLTPA